MANKNSVKYIVNKSSTRMGRIIQVVLYLEKVI